MYYHFKRIIKKNKYIYNFLICILNYKNNFIKLKKFFIERVEASKILKLLKKGKEKKAIIVYDNKCSPQAYGEFLNLIFLCRLLSVFFRSVEFIITNDGTREKKTYLKNIYDKQKQMASSLLCIKNVNVKFISGDSLSKIINNLNNQDYLFFKNKVENIMPIYIHAFNVFNIIASKLKEEVLKKILFNKDTLKHLNFKLPKKPYVTIGVRRSNDKKPRETKKFELFKMYKIAKYLFPNKKIIIVSDMNGCNFFRKFVQQKKLKIKFSKDVYKTNNYLADINIILNGNFHFQLNAGGISSAIWLSLCPYFISCRLIHERSISKNRITSWQTSEQTFCNNTKVTQEMLKKLYAKFNKF